MSVEVGKQVPLENILVDDTPYILHRKYGNVPYKTQPKKKRYNFEHATEQSENRFVYIKHFIM